MTVTIASTTDTEQDVTAANVEANIEPKPVSAAAETTPENEEAGEEVVTPDAESVDVASEEETPDEKIASEAVTEDVQAQDAEEKTEDTSEEIATAPKKRRRRGRSYKDRASQLAREKSIEAARANALERELQNLRQTQAAQPVEKPTEAPRETDTQEAASTEASSDGRPDQDKFESYEEYQEALVDWKVSRRLETHQQEERERIARDQAQRAEQDLVAAHQARIDEFRSEHDDFDVVVERGRNLPMTRPMQDTVLNSDIGPAMMYHLCRNPEECDRIATMHPLAAIKELGKLEARLEVATSGPTRVADSVTKAPKPIKPVGGSAIASSTVPLDQMDYQDYRRVRDKQEEDARANGRW